MRKIADIRASRRGIDHLLFMYPMTMAIDLFQVTVDRVRNDRPAALQQTAARLMSGYSSDVRWGV
ncbi:MAG TPA: hypothetical protein VM620_07135, partial [Hyphomicrobium sp.]|nr:hypothetical protein [Hyphomicrobium sp.]